jgi:hypothetical protein
MIRGWIDAAGIDCGPVETLDAADLLGERIADGGLPPVMAMELELSASRLTEAADVIAELHGSVTQAAA